MPEPKLLNTLWMTLATLPWRSATTNPVVSPSGSPAAYACALRASNAVQRRAAYFLSSSSATGTRACAGSPIQRSPCEGIALHDVERDEGGEALLRRRCLEHAEAAVDRRDRLIPLAGVLG